MLEVMEISGMVVSLLLSPLLVITATRTSQNYHPLMVETALVA